MLLLGVTGLFLEGALSVLLFECLELIVYIFVSLPVWIKTLIDIISSVVGYVFANLTRVGLLLKMIYSIAVIFTIMIFTFEQASAKFPLHQIIILIFFTLVYIAVLICKIIKLHKELRSQYSKQKGKFTYIGKSKGTYESSYIHFLLGLLIDEKKFIYWLTNIVFRICAPIAIIAFVYIQYCNIENLIYIVSLISIALALYSVWKTIDFNRETSTLLKEIVLPTSQPQEYATQKPDESESNSWNETL